MLDEAIGSFTETIKPLNLTAEDVIWNISKSNCKEGRYYVNGSKT